MRTLVADVGLVMIAVGVFLVAIFGLPVRGPEKDEAFSYIAVALLAFGVVFQFITPYPF
jgi:hypothetical protein